MKKGDKRYRYKLNMLEPGSKMLIITGIILIVAFVCYLLHWKLFCLILIGGGMLIFLILIILLAVEQHQDKVLYEDAKKKDKDIK